MPGPPFGPEHRPAGGGVLGAGLRLGGLAFGLGSRLRLLPGPAGLLLREAPQGALDAVGRAQAQHILQRPVLARGEPAQRGGAGLGAKVPGGKGAARDHSYLARFVIYCLGPCVNGAT